jgi:hypothetical protein
MPVSGLPPSAFQPNSGMMVLPRSTALCSRKRATGGEGLIALPRVEPRSVAQLAARLSPSAPRPSRARHQGEAVELGFEPLDAADERRRHLDGRERLPPVVLEKRARREKRDPSMTASLAGKTAIVTAAVKASAAFRRSHRSRDR